MREDRMRQGRFHHQGNEACGSNTYAQGYTSSAKAYAVVCTGLNHEAAGQGANFPQYTSAQGLITQ